MPLAGMVRLAEDERALFQRWLRPQWSNGSVSGYRHLRLAEDRSLRDSTNPLLLQLLRDAHDDARRYFSNAYLRTLDPRATAISDRAVSSYPALVERITLAGFFGEVLAGVIAEIYAPHGRRWLVPVFCFRAHTNVFRELIKAAEEDRLPRRAVGRLGDDCVAFTVDQTDATLFAVLLCEAKCSYSHRAASIAEGHTSLASTSLLQLELFRVIEILRDRRRDDDQSWIEAIERFRDGPLGSSRKCDLFSYAYGRAASNGRARLPADVKHPAHTSTADLVAVEVHLEGLEDFVSALYREAFVNGTP